MLKWEKKNLWKLFVDNEVRASHVDNFYVSNEDGRSISKVLKKHVNTYVLLSFYFFTHFLLHKGGEGKNK